MRVCYFGTYRDDYSRNKIIIESLKKASVDVIECHEKLWESIDQRVSLVKFGPNFIFLVQALKVYILLAIKYYQLCRNCDVIFVGYPGHFDVFFAWALAKLTKKPLILDFFMSLSLISKERELDKENKMMVKFLEYVECLGLRLPDLIIQDTDEYKKWLIKNYRLNNGEKIKIVPTGANDNVFVRRQQSRHKLKRNFTVLYYGTYIPNHGTQIIIEAASLLREYPEIEFIMVGRGPDLRLCKQLVSDYHLTNVKFIDWMEQNNLVRLISNSDVCLGAFGKTPQSLMTVHNKIYECLAMGKAVITGISPATEHAFANYKEIYLCERTPRSLADAIKTLYLDPCLRENMAENGYKAFLEKFSTAKIGQLLLSYLKQFTSQEES